MICELCGGFGFCYSVGFGVLDVCYLRICDIFGIFGAAGLWLV